MQAARAERILEALVGAGDIAVRQHSDVNPDLAHEDGASYVLTR